MSLSLTGSDLHQSCQLRPHLNRRASLSVRWWPRGPPHTAVIMRVCNTERLSRPPEHTISSVGAAAVPEFVIHQMHLTMKGKIASIHQKMSGMRINPTKDRLRLTTQSLDRYHYLECTLPYPSGKV